MTKISEPRIIIFGRAQSTIDVLVDELTRYGRNVKGTDNQDELRQWVEANEADFVCVGAGISDDARKDAQELVRSLNPDLPVRAAKRKKGANPGRMIGFVNEQAVMYKIKKATGK